MDSYVDGWAKIVVVPISTLFPEPDSRQLPLRRRAFSPPFAAAIFAD